VRKSCTLLSNQSIQGKLTDEERKEKAAAQALKKEQMESCLTEVRSYYHKEEKEVSKFVEAHPTSDKGRLTSKFLAQMMLKCMKEISPEQVAYLQSHKNTPNDLDYSTHEQLITIDWDELKYKGDGVEEDPSATRAVEMTPEEQMMSSEVEELSEEMRRETDIENRKSLGKTTLAFINLEDMSASVALVFVALAVVLFSSLGFFFYKNLFEPKEEPGKARRREIQERRAKKSQ